MWYEARESAHDGGKLAVADVVPESGGGPIDCSPLVVPSHSRLLVMASGSMLYMSVSGSEKSVQEWTDSLVVHGILEDFGKERFSGHRLS